MMIAAWSVTEVIRYSFYAFTLLGSVPYFLTWCRFARLFDAFDLTAFRYTFFIIVYPIGVTVCCMIWMLLSIIVIA
jgi:very-long-chain (3R)-3-hydroxyacyl-CoA dehydratase